METNINIRKADEKDSELVSYLATAAFFESHGHSGPPGDIKAFARKTYSEGVVKKELSDPENIFHLIYFKAKPAGYSKIIFNSPYVGNNLKNICKLERLYLLEEYYGQKLGAALFNYLIALMKVNSQQGVWLYTWKQNPRAIRFYEKMGFMIVGSYDFKISETHSNPNHQMFLPFKYLLRMKKSLAITIIVLAVISCSRPLNKRDEITLAVDRFLSYAERGNDEAIYNMCYHVDFGNDITNDEMRKRTVAFYQNIIKKFGIPPHEKWLFKKSPFAYEVHIPIPNYNDSTSAFKTMELIVYYTPPKIANKIFNADYTGDWNAPETTIPATQAK